MAQKIPAENSLSGGFREALPMDNYNNKHVIPAKAGIQNKGTGFRLSPG
jgi:hypothetical protein